MTAKCFGAFFLTFVCCLQSAYPQRSSQRFSIQDTTAALTFTEVSATVGIQTEPSGTHGVSVADFNADGLPDLYVCSQEDDKIPGGGYIGNYLFKNNGDGTFSRVEVAAGVDDPASYAHAAIFFDKDHDGDFDLAVGHGIDGLVRRGLFENNGDGTFTQLDATAGFEDSGDIGTRSIVAGDLNGDGIVDIHFSSFDGFDTEAYLGDGNGHFTRYFGLNDQSRSIQGMTAADLDGDGDVDVLMGNFNSDDGIGYYENDGQGNFTHVFGSGLPETGIYPTANVADVDADADLDVLVLGEDFGTAALYLNNNTVFSLAQQFPLQTGCPGGCGGNNGAFGDLDNDGDFDLFLPTGTPKLWLNDGSGNFVSVDDQASGLQYQLRDARFPALLDYDTDGDLDMVLARHDSSSLFFKNNIDNNQSLRLRITGPVGDVGGFGTKVWLYESGHLGDSSFLIAYQEALASSGYCIQNEPVLHFGLGQQTSADVHLEFIDGSVSDLLSVAAGQTLEVTPEGLQLVSPNGSESWLPGSTQAITWVGSHVIAEVKIEFSSDGGATWSVVSAATANDGSFDWLLPDIASDNCFIRLSDASDGQPTDLSDAAFSIAPAISFAQRVNAGGAAYTDGSGQDWEADQAFATGSWGYTGGNAFATTDAIANTADDVLYQSERFSLSGYSFTVPSGGTYQVDLHFAEIFLNKVGGRVFDVFLEGNLVLDDFDIYAQVGHDAALVQTFDVDVTDGVLDITFGAVVEEPKISAISVVSLTPDTTAPAISNVAASSITATSAVITWDTDESSDSQVEYGLDTIYGSSTSLDTALVTSHQVALTGLTANTTYHFRVKSSDANGNQAVSGDFTFTTEAPDVTPPVISNVVVSSITASAATVTWDTDESSDSQVEYGLDTTYGTSTSLDTALVTSHQVALTGLIADTTYHFRVLSADASANQAVSGDFTFTIAAVPEYEQRVNAGGSSYTDAGGQVWDADQAFSDGSWGYVDGKVFSTNDAVANTADDALYQSERHSLTGYRFTLPAGGTYQVELHFAEIYLNKVGGRLFDVSLEGNLVLDDLDIYSQVGHDAALVKSFEVDVTDGVLDVTFANVVEEPKISAILVKALTPDLTPPVISSVAVSEITAGSAKITWSTDEAADSEVEYGLDTSYGSTSGLDASLVTAHQVVLTGLSADTTYHFRVKSSDGSGNLSVSGDSTFTTEPSDVTPPVISNLAVSNITASDATITWDTDEAADSEVEYGLDITYGSTSGVDTALVTSHSVVLTGLSATTTYHFRVLSGDANGNLAVSGDSTFTTGAAVSYTQRVNAGGSSYSDSGGNVWDADQAFMAGSWGYVDGKTFSTKDRIANTTDDKLYQSERYRMVEYKFTVPANGTYQVNLHFSEIVYKESGTRLFDVKIEGGLVLDSFDIYFEAGHDAALVKTFNVDVNDGLLDIVFVKVKDWPKISAIEVTSLASAADLASIASAAESHLEAQSIPDHFELSHNYPNPFNAGTRLELALPQAGKVVAVIYNTLGQEVARLQDGSMAAGTRVLTWDGSNSNGANVGSGLYLLHLEYAPPNQVRQVVTRRLMLLK